MRQAFAHEAELLMRPEAGVRAPGAAITVALWGRWDHDPPCPLAPHHSQAERSGSEVRVRTVCAVEPDNENCCAAARRQRAAGWTVGRAGWRDHSLVATPQYPRRGIGPEVGSRREPDLDLSVAARHRVYRTRAGRHRRPPSGVLQESATKHTCSAYGRVPRVVAKMASDADQCCTRLGRARLGSVGTVSFLLKCILGAEYPKLNPSFPGLPGGNEMDQQFVGGLTRGNVRISPPWVLLAPTRRRLQFSLRFGLNRHYGPWSIDRQDVTSIYETRQGLLSPWPSLRILGDGGLDWLFRTYKPTKVLHCLAELRYPVDQGRQR